MQDPLQAALANPWDALRTVLDGPLHPGGTEATAALLERADVDTETRLLDLGCGEGLALAQARERGATAIGLDRDPGGDATLSGSMDALPLATGFFDVVLAECALCLSPSLDRSLAEIARVLGDDGRLALSDVVIEGPVPELPSAVSRALCLDGARSEVELRAAVAEAGFTVEHVGDHREDLLAMRDELQSSVAYEPLLRSLGEDGEAILDAIDQLEAAVEADRIGYVSLVAKMEAQSGS